MAVLVKRPQIITFLNTTPKGTSETWSLVGNYTTEGAWSYEVEETSETYIVDDNATTTIDGYNVSFDTEMKCAKGDAMYDFINGLRYNLATGTDAESKVLLIDKYDEVSSGTFKAQVFNCSVSISEYGGAGGETPTISYKINCNGNPKKGTATITSGVPTFTESTSI